MNVLAIESSATACSVAFCKDSQLIAQHFLHSGLTHSKTLLPMISNVLEQCATTMSEVDFIATAVGPGSFTGLRIGVSTAKGLAFAHKTPCAPCSTLASMACQLAHLEGFTVVCVMDARRNQVYHSRFIIKNGIPQRLSPDGALDIQVLQEELDSITTPKILVGDGALLCSEFLKNIHIAPAHLRQQLAWGVAQEGIALKNQEKLVTCYDLEPEYHRLSQAERERLEKESAKKQEIS